MPNDIVVLDSNEIIFGLLGNEPYPKILIDNLNVIRLKYDFLINRQIKLEVESNLPKTIVGKFNRLLSLNVIKVDNEELSNNLITKYKQLGLKKGDIIIAGFTEFKKAKYIVSENRHFLSELNKKDFEVLSAKEFLEIIGLL